MGRSSLSQDRLPVTQTSRRVLTTYRHIYCRKISDPLTYEKWMLVNNSGHCASFNRSKYSSGLRFADDKLRYLQIEQLRCNTREQLKINETFTNFQILAADLLQKLALSEEGRRYLNFSSKISCDIKRILRKKSANLDFDTLKNLNTTLNFLNPPINQQVNVTYYCKPFHEGNKRKFSNRCEYESPYKYVKKSKKYVLISYVDKECNTSIKRPKIKPEYTD